MAWYLQFKAANVISDKNLLLPTNIIVCRKWFCKLQILNTYVGVCNLEFNYLYGH